MLMAYCSTYSIVYAYYIVVEIIVHLKMGSYTVCQAVDRHYGPNSGNYETLKIQLI